jgi:serine phosphatase RsbU (regulator of sigma subunit)
MLYTDGLVEAGNAAGEMFGDHIDAHIAAHAALPASIFADALLKDVSAWSSRQEDDLTLLVADIA